MKLIKNLLKNNNYKLFLLIILLCLAFLVVYVILKRKNIYESMVYGIPVSINEWNGWATTTQDIETKNLWPGEDSHPSIDYDKIGAFGDGNRIGSITITKTKETIDVMGTMPCALPWSILSSVFGYKTRTEFISTIVASCDGSNPVPCCFIIQSINKFPSELAPLSDGNTNALFDTVNNICKDNCTDINDTSVVATYNTSVKFPAYFIVPSQGCGGDGSMEYPDNWDSCQDLNKITENFNYYTKCKDNSNNPFIPAPGCSQIKWMSDNNWKMTDDIEQQYYDNNNATFAISKGTEFGDDMNTGLKNSKNINHLNFCSGKNMHFNIKRLGSLNPYWCDLLYNCSADEDNSINFPGGVKNGIRGGKIGNTMVRYIVVPGNIFGNFNILEDGGVLPKPIPSPSCN